jgi:DNA-3-methyladenine glycosylase II
VRSICGSFTGRCCKRLCDVVQPLTPENFLTLDDPQLKGIGFSRQKMLYGRELANAIMNSQLDLSQLETMDETTIRTELKRIKGIVLLPNRLARVLIWDYQ